MQIFCLSLFSLCMFIILLANANGQDSPCTQIDQCSCGTRDGKVIDLSSLGNNDGTPRFKDFQAPDGYMYSYNPCYPFSEMGCEDQSVCKISPDGYTSYAAGDATGAVFTNNGLNNIITYASTDSRAITRTTQVTLICDQTAGDASLTLFREQGSIYYLTLTTKCACPNGCLKYPRTVNPEKKTNDNGKFATPKQHDQPTGSHSTLNIGSVICISVFAVLVMFLVGGIVIWIRRRQAGGTTAVPYNTLDGELKRY